jgi:hypothetical protein
MCEQLKGQDPTTASWSVHYKKPVAETVGTYCIAWNHTPMLELVSRRLSSDVSGFPFQKNCVIDFSLDLLEYRSTDTIWAECALSAYMCLKTLLCSK